MKYYPHIEQGQTGEFVSLVLILGVLIAFLLNCVVNGFMLVFILRRKPVWKHFPRWLIIANFLFLLPQIILFAR